MVGTGAGGKAIVDPNVRARILALRMDARISSLMAGELARENIRVLERALGRRPSGAETYAAHFLGADGTAKLIRAAAVNPQIPAASLLPAAAASNPTIFFAQGRPVGARALLERLWL